MRVIPAIDIIDGKCVRLTNGDYSKKKVYNENPIEVAKAFEDHGFKFLHLVDLDGAKSNHIVNHKVLEVIATKTNLNIDFGGGLKSNKDLAIAFECGAKKITGGLQATAAPELVLKNFPNINYLITGESEIILSEIADLIDKKKMYHPQKLNFLKISSIFQYI